MWTALPSQLWPLLLLAVYTRGNGIPRATSEQTPVGLVTAIRAGWPVPLWTASLLSVWIPSVTLTTAVLSVRTVRCVAVCLLVGCLTSQQHASVSQGRICSDNFTCCHTEIEAADQTFYLTQSQYTDTGPTSPSADSITPGAWQGSHWSANF